MTATIAANSVTDAASTPNSLAAAATETWTAPVDNTAPTLAITHSPADSTAVGNDGIVTFTFTFTDASGIATSGAGAFATGDITITGGTKGTFATTSNLVYTLKVTPTTPHTDVTATVASGSVTDAASTPNSLAAAVAETWTAPTDRTAPTLAITHSPVDNGNLESTGKVTFTFTFTDGSGLPTSGAGAFATADITIVGGTKGTFAGSGLVYTLKVTPTTPYTDVTATVAKGSVTDNSPAKNKLAAAVAETWAAPADTTSPTLAITHSPADSTAVGNDGIVTFTFTWTDASGIATSGAGAFTTSDITVTGGTKGDFSTTSNLVYTLKVTPTTPHTSVKVKVPAASVTDAASTPNGLTADATETWTAPTVDNTAPTLVITHITR